MGTSFCKHPLQSFLPLRFKHLALAVISGRITNQMNSCVQEMLSLAVLRRRQQMLTLISCLFPLFSQLIFCFSVGSTNIFAAGKNCTSPIQLFFNFKHLKFQQMLAVLAWVKTIGWCGGLIFWERDREKAKHRAKLLLKLRESQELKGCTGKNQKIQNRSWRNIISIEIIDFEQLMVFLSCLVFNFILANYLLFMQFAGSVCGHWETAHLLSTSFCSWNALGTQNVRHSYPNWIVTHPQALFLYPAQRLWSLVLNYCWAWMQERRCW